MKMTKAEEKNKGTKRILARLVSRELPEEMVKEISGGGFVEERCWHTKNGKFDAIDCK